MSFVITAVVALAAAIFIAISAIMNALFLSSLGRTPVEIALLGAVSISSDLVKAVLPVLIVRAVVVRAWVHGAMASLMLIIVVVLSLASGTGFAALTRNAAVASRDNQAEALTALTVEARNLDADLASLATVRQVAVIEADIAAKAVDRLWALSKSCTEISGATARKFCSDVAVLRSEQATAATRDRLTAERRGTRARIDALRNTGAGGASDPQAAAIAALLGVDTSTPRRVLPVALAVVLELGGVILVLLLAGPTVRRWREPALAIVAAPAIPTVTIPVKNPHPRDLVSLQVRRSASKLADTQGGSHAR